MTRTIKTALLALIAILAVVVAVKKFMPAVTAPAENRKVEAEEPAPPGPFDGLGLRYDGHYRCERGSLRYLMRFFPEGRVVMVGGTKEVEATLPDFLIRDTKGDPSIGLHNVMAEVRGDSIFMVTRPLRGEITYRGKVMSPARVHFFRHSHITGADYDMDYDFVSDSARASGQQPS